MSYLVLDIETVPDLEIWTRPEPEPGKELAFPPPAAHRVVAIGVALFNDELGFVKIGAIAHRKDEPDMLREFSEYVDKNRPTLVTWNGRGFDLPVLMHRCMRHRIPMPWYYQARGYRYRYSDEGHCDLMDVFGDYGAARNGKLDVAAKLIGLPGKSPGESGASVEEMWRAGKATEIRDYCLRDVAMTSFLLLRYHLMSGKLTEIEHNSRAAALFGVCEKDDALAPLAKMIDTAVLFGQPKKKKRKSHA